MNANAPRISGLEPPESATDTQSAPELAAATVEAEPPMTEAPRSSKLSLRTMGLIAAILVAAGAGLYTCILQQKVQVLRTQLVRTQAAAQAALARSTASKSPRISPPTSPAWRPPSTSSRQPAKPGRRPSMRRSRRFRPWIAGWLRRATLWPQSRPRPSRR